jgi:hypothetical protein
LCKDRWAVRQQQRQSCGSHQPKAGFHGRTVTHVRLRLYGTVRLRAGTLAPPFVEFGFRLRVKPQRPPLAAQTQKELEPLVDAHEF